LSTIYSATSLCDCVLHLNWSGDGAGLKDIELTTQSSPDLKFNFYPSAEATN